MSLRQRLKTETRHSHQLLESTYPYCEILDSENIEQIAEKFLLCFKIKFQNFCLVLSEDNQYFNISFNDLLAVDLPHNMQLREYQPSRIIALKYLLLGSRMGNKLAISKNPKLLKTSHSNYFSRDLPADLWQSLITDLDKIEEKNWDCIVREVNEEFSDLILIGNQVAEFG